MKELLQETIELDVEESNELLFHVKVEGIDQGSTKIRLVCEANDLSYMFTGKVVDRNGLVQFNVPVMKDKLGEGTFQSRIEVLIENKMFAPRFFTPAKFNIAFKKAVGVVAEAVDASLNSVMSEINVTAKPVVVKNKSKNKRNNVIEERSEVTSTKNRSLTHNTATNANNRAQPTKPLWLTSIVPPSNTPQSPIEPDLIKPKQPVVLQLDPIDHELSDKLSPTSPTVDVVSNDDIATLRNVIDGSSVDVNEPEQTHKDVVKVSVPYDVIAQTQPESADQTDVTVDNTTFEPNDLFDMSDIVDVSDTHGDNANISDEFELDLDLPPDIKAVESSIDQKSIEPVKKLEKVEPNTLPDEKPLADIKEKIPEKTQENENNSMKETLKDRFNKRLAEKQLDKKPIDQTQQGSISNVPKTLKERFKSVDKSTSLLAITRKITDKSKN